MLNLIIHQPDIDKIYSYAKDPYEAKYQLLINKREVAGIKHFNNSEAFIEYWNDMNDTCKNIEEDNPNKKRKTLIAFDDKIADMLKKRNPIVTELFIIGKHFSCFYHTILFCCTKNIILNSTLFHYENSIYENRI